MTESIKLAGWLDCETLIDGEVRVAMKLKCCVYTRHKQKKTGQRNFSDKWITVVELTMIRDGASTSKNALCISTSTL